MGKKKTSRKTRSEPPSEQDFDDALSITSDFTAFSMGDIAEPELLELSPFERCIEALYEKRATTREKALETLCSLLTANYCYEEAVLRQETLSNMFLGSLRRGGPLEAALAARGLGLHAVTLGASDAAERVFQESQAVLQRSASQGKSVPMRCAAVDTLALLAFIAVEDPATTSEVMDLFFGLWRTAAPKVQAPALRGWSLLLSTVPAWRLQSGAVEAQLSQLSRSGLHDKDVDVRAAAGEAIALLYDITGLGDAEGGSAAGSSSDEDIDAGKQRPGDAAATADAGTGAVNSSGTRAGAPGVAASGLQDVVARMEALATNRGDQSRRSKRDRASLRGTFRDLCCVLQDGSVVETRIKMRHGDSLVVNTLVGTVQVNFLRRFLAEGFQVHLQLNPLMHEIFAFSPREEPADRLTPLEKRMYRSPGSATSKMRTQQRRSDRASTSAYKSAMIGDDFG